VRPLGVVVLPPGVHRGLSLSDRLERRVDVQQFVLQDLVQALDLAGGRRRAGPGQPLGDAVLAADPLEQHLGRAGLAEPPGELLAIVGQHLLGDAVNSHRGQERRAHRPAGGPHHDGGDHAEPGMVINPGDDLAFAAVRQEHAGGHVQLPQLHRLLPLPPLVVLAAALALTGRHQATADQHPVDRRPGRQRAHPRLAQLEQQPSRTPPRMCPAQLADQRLNLGIQLPRLMVRPVRMISQTG
jgi:hypothetical protein